MKNLKTILTLILIAIAFTVKAQTPATAKRDTSNTKRDTSMVFCAYIIDSATGASRTGFVERILTYKHDFAQPTEDQLKSDSVVLKKRDIVIGADYYVPVNKDGKISYIYIPNDFIIYDYNKKQGTFTADPYKKYKPIP